MAKKENYEVAESTPFEVELTEGESTGFEETSSSIFKTPFLKILQSLSPELKKNDPKFVEGAEEGMYINTATQELSSELEIVVLKIAHSLVVWKPKRGGFAGHYPNTKESEVVASKEGVAKWDADGNDVVDTIELFCMDINNPANVFILPISKASYKHGKTFATRMRLLTSMGKPVKVTWAGVWRISTVEERNDDGSWFTIGSTPEFVRFITAEEKANLVSPAMDMLKNAETDYTVVESLLNSDGDEGVTY